MFGRALATVDNKALKETEGYDAHPFYKLLLNWRDLWIESGRPANESHSENMKKFRLNAALGMENPKFMAAFKAGQLSTRTKVGRTLKNVRSRSIGK